MELRLIGGVGDGRIIPLPNGPAKNPYNVYRVPKPVQINTYISAYDDPYPLLPNITYDEYAVTQISDTQLIGVCKWESHRGPATKIQELKGFAFDSSGVLSRSQQDLIVTAAKHYRSRWMASESHVFTSGGLSAAQGMDGWQ